MRSTNSKLLLVAASVAMLAAPALAQMGPPPDGPPPDLPRKHRHHGDVGAGIAAGVLGGIAGAAIANGGNRPPPPGPRYGAYDEDDSCRVVRKPVYDEDGEVVSYRTRRVCD